MELSKRLHGVALFAQGAETLADVGTDHGYVPIYLVEEEKIKRAIAMDINKGPLARAQENIKIHGLENAIETRLSDGVEALKPGEADTVVIAGMGGALMIHILEKGREILAKTETLVLQPQSEIAMVRRYLQKNGFRIVRENMVRDDGKYYIMMKVVHGQQSPWEDYEYRYGKYLVHQSHPVLKEFLEKELQTFEEILEDLKGRPGEHVLRRIQEVEDKIEVIKEAKENMR